MDVCSLHKTGNEMMRMLFFSKSMEQIENRVFHGLRESGNDLMRFKESVIYEGISEVTG